MLELLVSLCLADAPSECRVEQRGAYESQAACQAAGRAAEIAVQDNLQAWTCGPNPFWVSEVAPGLFVHKGQHAEPSPGNRGDTANIGYIVGADSVAVIDAGGSDAVAQDLLDDIRRRTDLPIKHLILTHMHPDHVLGAGVFVDAGAEVLGHPNLASALAARHAFYVEAYQRELGEVWSGRQPFPTITVAPARLDLGGRVLELRQHGLGHTSNDLTVFDTQTGVWLMGDLVFLDHMPSIDGSLRGWAAELTDAKGVPAARIVPGHGPVLATWPQAANPTRDYLLNLADRVREAIDSGMPLLDAVTEIGGESAPDWRLSETFHPRNVTSAYRELEWD